MLYMFLADGFEETEAVGCLDIIRRAGIDIKTVSVENGNIVKGSHGISVCSDIMLDDAEISEASGIILPGGMSGTLNLQKNKTVEKFIFHCAENGKLLAAICAAPMIFGRLGLLKGKKATCYPGYESELDGCEYIKSPTVVSDNFITGNGAGSAMLFGAAIVNYFKKGKGDELLSEVQHR